ncbi:MAG: hypothetical protein QOK41_924 [Sphingomonadales bacterium]|jgi:hypothetical protein|nr:hypothetical protein [Sphingomonadales bacterium]
MTDPVIHSTSWTGDVGARHTIPSEQAFRPLSHPRASGILASGAWMVGGALLFSSANLSAWIIPAIPIAVPPIWSFGYTSTVALVLFIRSMSRELSPITIRISLLAALVLFSLAILLPPLAIYSYLHAEEGPKHRMQFVSASKNVEGAIFAFQNGSAVETPFYWRSQWHYRRSGECFGVRRYTGPFGFSWMKVLETTPPPKNSELWWTISQEDCFSNKPLSALGH